MKLRDVVRLSVMSAMRGKLRSALTICAISIGVASVALMLSIGEGSRGAVAGQLDQIGLDGIIVYPKEVAKNAGVTLSADDAAYLSERLDGIDCAMPFLTQYGSYKMKNWQGNVVLLGVDENISDAMNLNLLYGRLPSEADLAAGRRVVVLDSTFAETVYQRENIVGKEIKLYVGTDYENFEVIGIIASQSDGLVQLVGQSLPEFVYLPYTAMQSLTGSQEVAQLLIQTEDEAVKDRVLYFLDRRYGTEDSFKYEDIGGLRNRLDGALQMVTMFIGAVAAISIVVAGIGVMNTMMSAAAERRREIGVYMALGASERDIMISFLMESGLISAFGGLLGILIGFLGTVFASRITGIAFLIQPQTACLIVGGSILCGVAFGMIPALRASRLSPMEALREE